MKEFLDKAAEQYYEGTPLISDAEWDILAKKHHYKKVGYSPTDGVPHTFRMYSLQNCFEGEKFPIDEIDWLVTSPKLDGSAIAVTYINGKLVQALTRGDGKVGKDITEKAKTFLPTNLRANYCKAPSVFQITGEVVLPKSIKNSRNVAAGSLNLKDIEEFKSRNVSFFAYDCQPHIEKDWSDDMEILARAWGIPTVYHYNKDEFPTDGVVYRIDNNDLYFERGYTAHHPRGAFALKEVKAGVQTTLRDVIWQVGKSGAVSPVALLDPVLISDALISRATLHNMEYINQLGLEIGCQVEVIRSGEIIPRVVRRV